MKKTLGVQIGDRIIIDEVEWKVAEIQENEVTLYHEGVAGNSHTMKKTIDEVKLLLSSMTKEL